MPLASSDESQNKHHTTPQQAFGHIIRLPIFATCSELDIHDATCDAGRPLRSHMRTSYVATIAFGLGTAFGITALTGLHAQSGAPGAYFVTEVEITNPDVFKQHASKVGATVAPFGGQYLSRGGKIGAIDGPAPQSVAIIGFESIEKAQAWRGSPAYKELIPERDSAAKVKSYAVEAKVN